MNRKRVVSILITIVVVWSLMFSTAYLPQPVKAAGTCGLTAGQVVINEVLPSPASGPEWVELFNMTWDTLDIGNCYLDDIAGGGSAPIQIPAGTTIGPHGFWTLDMSYYYNNGGDDVRLLLDDASTVLDSFSYGSTDYNVSWYRSTDGGSWAGAPTSSPTKGGTNSGGICGTGSWTSGNLEIHHINISQGDSTLIVGPTGKTLLFDAGEENWNSSGKAQIIGPYIEGVLGCKHLDYVVISHFHLDHIGYVAYGGLWHLVETQNFTVGTTLLRDYNTYLGNTSGTFDNWKIYIEGSGAAKLNPVTAIEGTSQVDLEGGVTFDIITVDGNGAILAGDFSGDTDPPSENDYSIGVLISFGAFDEWIGGDLDGEYSVGGFGYSYHDIELSAAPEVGDVDVYKVNHHGSDHSNSETFVNQLDPEVSIVTVGDGNTYGHPRQTVMNLVLATSDVYMTERGELTTDIGDAVVAGHIEIKTSNGTNYTVNGTAYTATEPTRTDADGDGYFAEVDPADGDGDVKPAPNGGCDPTYQPGCSNTCQVTAGQVAINEVLPAPSSGAEWLELYNTTGSVVNIGFCYLDDIGGGGSAAVEIPAGTTIPAHGFWTRDFGSYFNNGGDDVRFLKEDASTVLDSYTYGSTGYDVSWYRNPDGGAWAGAATSTPTKGSTNTPVTVPVPVSPSGLIDGVAMPTFVWNVFPGATSYKLAVWSDAALAYVVQAVVATSACNATQCSYPSPINLANGSYKFKVMASYSGGNTPYSDWMAFTIINVTIPPPTVPPTPIAPNTTVNTHRPTFQWNAVTNATFYRLAVYSYATYTYLVVENIYPTCVAGVCSYTPSTWDLVNGSYGFKMRSRNSSGYTDFGTMLKFSVSSDLPVAPTLLAPSGTVGTARPEFQWSVVSGATKYRLLVYSVASGSFVINTYVLPSACSGGVCSYVPSSDLASGGYKFKMSTYNSYGASGYSAYKSFVVP